MADVFISYKREEIAWAARVAQALSEEGFSAFYDLDEDGIHAGEEWDKRLEKELAAAKCCLVLWSRASTESANVRSEARRANGRGILAPAKVNACQAPIGLDNLQEADLSQWRGDRSDVQWRFLVDRGVARKVGRAGRPPKQLPPPVPPPPQSLPRGEKASARSLPKWFVPAGLAGLALVGLLAWSLWSQTGPVTEPETAAVEAPAAPVGDPATPTGSALADGQAFRDCADCPEMVVIPAGSFVMGSPAGETDRGSDEGPQRTVSISRFAAGKFEVTFDEWERCVAGGGCRSTANPGDQGWGRGRRPAINVSWNDAEEYVQWLSQKTGQRYRLMTEAEWEYATRGKTNGTASEPAFWWGNSINASQANYDASYTYNNGPKGQYRQQTEPVGTFQANPFGLYDVHGNVWEWVQDCYVNTYSGAPTNGSAVTAGDCSSRVLRGGSWNDDPLYLRSAGRNWSTPTDRGNGLGFRLARTVSPPNR